jgi:microcystin-dependent protein
MAFGFPPKGWAQCNGQLLPINQNQALFALLGTMYGGDGRTTFALPNLQGSVAAHRSDAFSQGSTGGEESHTLTVAEQPVHTHNAQGTSTAADSEIAAGNFLGGAPNAYAPLANPTALDPSALSSAGGGQAHENRQPYLTLNFCIALQGVFPSRN